MNTHSEASAWFEPLYKNADGDSAQIPWALMTVTPYLQTWLQTATANGRSAAVS
ncbi:MAG: SAM-dependent methyltransferase, partial [Leptolyngbya sp. SIO3F4]|nr:SAM-dependent methyltransferase [Leptolyngbya sp. SIO3F4]